MSCYVMLYYIIVCRMIGWGDAIPTEWPHPCDAQAGYIHIMCVCISIYIYIYIYIFPATYSWRGAESRPNSPAPGSLLWPLPWPPLPNRPYA